MLSCRAGRIPAAEKLSEKGAKRAAYPEGRHTRDMFKAAELCRKWKRIFSRGTVCKIRNIFYRNYLIGVKCPILNSGS